MREIVMPKASMTMTEGDLAEWFVEDGATVREGEPVASIITDKVDMEVEAPADGRVGIMLDAGVTVDVGVVIGVLLEGEESKPAEVEATPNGAAAEPPEAAASAPSPEAESAPPEEPTPQPTAAASEPSTAAAAAAERGETPPEAVRASPAARKKAQKLGVDLAGVAGTGPRGRIRPDDVDADHDRNGAGAAEAPTTATSAPAPAPVEASASNGKAPPPPAADGPEELRRHRPTGVRAAMARQMDKALQVPQFCLFADLPFMGLDRARRALAHQDGSKIGITDILLRAVGVALAEHPALNAHWVDGEIVEFRAVNLGIAADTPNGLMVPVLAGVEKLTLADVAARSTALTASARAGMLRIEDVSGATFTVSNLGMMGISHFQPLVNPPQVAILSVGAGRGDAGRTTTLGLAADHRAVDGAQAARFLQTLRDVVEVADHAVLAGG